MATIGSLAPRELMGEEFFVGARDVMRDDLALFARA
jgi:hypothetical protein